MFNTIIYQRLIITMIVEVDTLKFFPWKLLTWRDAG